MRRKINILIIWLAVFSSVRMLIGSTSTLFLISRGIVLERIIFLKGLQFLTIFIFELPIGYFADRINKKISVLLSVFFAILWMIITAYSPTSNWLYVGEFFNALSIASMSGAFDAIIINLYRNQYGDNVSLEKLYGKIKYIVFTFNLFAVIISSLFFNISSSFFWWLGASILIIQIVFFSHVIPSPQSKIKKEKINKTVFIKDIKSTVFILVTNKKLLLFFCIQFLLGIYFQLIIQYWQPIYNILLQHFFLDDKKILFGIMFSIIILIQAISGLLVNKATNNFPFLKFSSLLLFLSLITLYLGLHGYYILIAISLIVLFFSISILNIIISSVINFIIPNTLRASSLSFLSMILRLGLVVFSLVFPILFRKYNFNIFIYLGMVILLFLIVFPFEQVKNKLGAGTLNGKKA